MPTEVHAVLSKADALNYCHLIFLVVVANIGSFLFGYEAGAASWLLAILHSDSGTATYYTYVENREWMVGLVASSASLGATLSYPFLLVFANEISKKDEILISAFFYFSGALMESISSQLDWNTYNGLILLLVGRILYGTGISTTLHAVPQYLTEMIPADVRGQYSSSIELTVVTGMVVGYAVGSGFQDSGWTWTFRFAYIMAIIMGVISVYIPHNPIWLIFHEFSFEEVLESIRFIQPHSESDDVQMLMNMVQEEKIEMKELENRLSLKRPIRKKEYGCCFPIYESLTTTQMKVIFHTRILRQCVWLQCGISLIKIYTGQTAIIYFASTICSDLYPDHSTDIVVAYIMLRWATAVLMLFIGDTFGRRTFMLTSAVSMACSMFLLYLGFAISVPFVAVVGLVSSGVGFQLGFGSIAHLYLNEVVPFRIRSTGNAIANFVLFASFFVLTFVFPYMDSYMGLTNIFLLLFLVNIVSMYVVFYYFPETKGVDVEKAYRLVGEMCAEAPCNCCSFKCCKGTHMHNYEEVDADDDLPDPVLRDDDDSKTTATDGASNDEKITDAQSILSRDIL